MTLKVVPSTLILLFILIGFSCKKESSNGGGGTVMPPLEKRADSVKNYVVGKSFIPVDFYASKPIDYNQDDSIIQSITDLKPFLMLYLTDDKIVLRADHHIDVDQGTKRLLPVPPDTDTLPLKFDSLLWEVTTKKATNEVFLDYLNYTYEPRRYSVESFNETGMLAYVIWQSKLDPADTARLYTRFLKK
jgi:hypothetical protein